MALSERDRRALILGGAALGIIAAYLLVVKPLVNGYHGLLREHDAVAQAAARKVYEQRKADYLTAAVKEWEDKAGTLSPPKPYSEQITAVGERIVAAAQESGVQLQGTTPSAASAWPGDGQVSQATMQIEAQSNWESVFKFVAALYRIPGVVSVETMDLTGEKGGEKLKLRLGVSVLVAPVSEKRWAS